tara:strand:- start:51802 stop:52530 length:729 start_codon:yes stop_codon:yes gene_type:complete
MGVVQMISNMGFVKLVPRANSPTMSTAMSNASIVNQARSSQNQDKSRVTCVLWAIFRPMQTALLAKRVPLESFHTRAELMNACFVIWECFRIKQGNRVASHVQQENSVGWRAHQNARRVLLENMLLSIPHANAKHALLEHIKTTAEGRAVLCVEPGRFPVATSQQSAKLASREPLQRRTALRVAMLARQARIPLGGLKPVSNVKDVRLTSSTRFVGWMEAMALVRLVHPESTPISNPGQPAA